MERRYTVKSTGYSSDRYGKCEVCGGHASEVFTQRGEGGDKPVLHTFGHSECLRAVRRRQSNTMSDDFCIIHGPVLKYDRRSGFDICEQCERERALINVGIKPGATVCPHMKEPLDCAECRKNW